MTETKQTPRGACPDRLNELKMLAETGEAPEGFVTHASGCPACRAAAKELFEQRQTTLDKMESVVDGIEKNAPPSRAETIVGRVGTTLAVGLFLAAVLMAVSLHLRGRAEGRNWRLARQVEARVKPVLADPIRSCTVRHSLLCSMTGDKDACSAERWYFWIPLPAPTKAICFVDAYYTYKHPDHPAFYVVDGDEAIVYRICGELAPADCPRPAKELGRVRLPAVR